MTHTDPSGPVPVTQDDVTEADKAAVTRFHAIQIKRIMAGDSTLGEDGRQTIEQAFAERRLAGIAEGRRLSSGSDVSHSDDLAVDAFASEMKAKLAAARAKGRGGWNDPDQCTTDHLRQLLHEHVAKGDPVDVANFCMMLSHYGAFTSLDSNVVTVPKGEAEGLRQALIAIARFVPKEHPNGKWSEGVSEWNRAGRYVSGIARTALASLSGSDVVTVPSGMVEGLRGLRGNFERIAALPPDDQPCYANGIRPFGTGDLRHAIETLTAAAAILSDLAATPTPTGEGA